MLRRFSFYLGVLLAAVLILTAGALWLARQYAQQFDPSVWLAQQLGRPVAIRGGVSYSFFPWLGVSLNQLEIGQASGSLENRPFLTAERVTVRVRLLPLLLHKEIALGRVSLHSPTLTLRRYADGRSNWDDLLSRPLFSSNDKQDSAASQDWMQRITLRGVEASNGALVWEDSRNVETLRFDAIRLSAGAGLRFHFDLDFHGSDHKRGLEGKALLSGECHLARDPFDLTLSDVDYGFTVNVSRSGEVYPVAAAGQASFSLNAQDLAVSMRSLDAFGLTCALDAHARRILDPIPEIQGKLKLLSGELEPRLAQKLPPGVLKRLAHLKAETVFSFEDKRLILSDVKGASGDMSLTASASCNFNEKPFPFKAALSLSKLDIDEFFPERSSQTGNAQPGSASAPQSGPSNAFDPRALLSGELNLDVGELKVRGAMAKEIAVQISLAPESATARMQTGQLFGGKGELSLEWKKTNLAATLGLERVQAGALSQNLLGRESLKGQTDLKLTASANGDSLQALASSLQAKLEATLANAQFAVPAATKASTEPSPSKNLTQAPAETSQGKSSGKAADPSTADAKSLKPLFSCDKGTITLSLGPPGKNAAPKVYPQVLYGMTLDARCDGGVAPQAGFIATSTMPANLTLNLTGKTLLDAQAFRFESIEQAQLRAQLRGKILDSKTPQEFKLATGIEYHREKDVAQLKSVTLTVPHARFGADLEVKNVFNQGQNALSYAGSLNIPVFNPRELIRALGYEMPVLVGDYCFHAFGLTAKTRGGLSGVYLDNMTMRLDKTTTTGRYSLTAAADPNAAPLSRFDIVIDYFDLDAYFPPHAKEKKPYTPDDDFRLGIMRTLPLQGDVFLHTFKFYDFVFKNLKAYGEGPSGAIHVRRLAGDFYDGKVTGTVNFFFAPNHVFSIDTDLKAKDFQLGPAVRDLGGGEYLGGLSQLTVSLNSTGLYHDAFLNRLTGKADLHTQNGYCILGTTEVSPPSNPMGEMGKIGQQPTPQTKTMAPYKVTFETAKATCTASNGVARNDDLRISGGMLNAHGSGLVYLVERKMDYNINLQILGTPSYPIRVYGPYDKLIVETSESKMLTDTAVRIGGSFFDVFKGVLTLPFKAIDMLTPNGKTPENDKAPTKK
jgi:AsmA protein